MPKRTRLLMAVLFETGMRPGEGCGLKKLDILPERKIHVQRTLDYWRNEGPPKNGLPRYCDIPEELYKALMAIPSLPMRTCSRPPRDCRITRGR
jgi:integrase